MAKELERANKDRNACRIKAANICHRALCRWLQAKQIERGTRNP